MATETTTRVTHTPGPWRIITADMLPSELDLDPSALIIANLNAETAEAAVVADIWTVGEGSAVEQEANARLVAAAPQLLALVEDYVLHSSDALTRRAREQRHEIAVGLLRLIRGES